MNTFDRREFVSRLAATITAFCARPARTRPDRFETSARLRQSRRERNDVAIQRRRARAVVDVLSATSAEKAGRLAPHAAIQAAHLWRSCRSWLNDPLVCGVGIGHRTRRGRADPHICMKVFVEYKAPSEDVEGPVPSSTASLDGMGRVPVDVEAIGAGMLDQSDPFRIRVRPLQPSAPIGISARPPGSFACFVEVDEYPGKVFLLSNSHVIAAMGSARSGRPVYQPPRPRHSALKIGGLTVDIDLEPSAEGYPNLVDVALAEVNTPLNIEPSIPHIGQLRGLSMRPTLGQRIRKFGPASRLRWGKVVAETVSVHLRMRVGGASQRIGFRDVVMCERYALPGDSGSAVVTDTGHLAGIHFASSEFRSYFMPIQNVLTEFKAREGLTIRLHVPS
jgi:hypothetical protein